MMEIEDPKVTMEELAEAGEFEPLDVKLAAAVYTMARGRISMIISTMTEAAAAKGMFVSGRQLLRTVYRQYEIDSAKGQVHDLSSLLAMDYPGDDRMEGFLDTWNSVINSLSKDPGEDVLREILYPLLRKSHKLQPALQIYDLADEDTPQHSYQFLIRVITKHVEKERHSRNRAALVGALNKLPSYSAKTAMPVMGTEKDKIITEEASTAAPAASKKGGDKGVCFAFQKGSCKRGSGCKYQHIKDPSAAPMTEQEKAALAEKRATMPCPSLARGHCRFGDKCQFDHGQTTAAACTETNEFDEMDYDEMRLGEDRDLDGPAMKDEHINACAAKKVLHEWVVDTRTDHHFVAR